MALAFAWRCSPVDLRNLTVTEATAMVELLEYLGDKAGGDLDGLTGHPQG